MDLEWDFIKAPLGVMCKCPNTFVLIVYAYALFDQEVHRTLGSELFSRFIQPIIFCVYTIRLINYFN